RGAGAAARPAAAKPAKAETGRPPSAPAPEKPKTQIRTQKKLSFHQQHALKTLPRRIAALEAEIAAAEAELASPDFYARDPEGFTHLSRELEEKQAERARCEDEWLELELLREELENWTGSE